MLNLRLETKNIQPEQIEVRWNQYGDFDVTIPAGPWTRASVAYSTAYAVLDFLLDQYDFTRKDPDWEPGKDKE